MYDQAISERIMDIDILLNIDRKLIEARLFLTIEGY